MKEKLRIIVGGLVGQFPLGGVAWDYFHYCMALHELGHDVYYHEDTWVWPFDPVKRYPTDDPDFSVRFIRDFFDTYAPELSSKWHYVLLHDKSFGMTRAAFDEVAKTADIFLNVSGACFFPDNLSPKCVKVFMDTDPGYNQIMLHEKFAWSEHVERWCKQVAAHDRHLTYAENIYADDCVIPRMDFDWQPTRPVVSLKPWAQVRDANPPPGAPFTTVMTWDWFRGKLLWKGVEYGQKVPEYDKFHDLPRRVPEVPLALAIGGHKTPYEKVKEDGWVTLDAYTATGTPQSYLKFIGDSLGEWSVAKNVYVATRSGWFSCRTACYLAAGRPAVVQDTAWSRYVPSGNGIIAFNTMDQAVAGVKEVSENWPRHRAAAYDVAREYLAPDKVLPPMIEAIYSPRRAKPTSPGPIPPSRCPT
ncbi:MAG: glycosyltransferase family 1 protein [Tepidisphaeraceae bacterium]